MGEAVKTVVAELLAKDADRRVLLSDGQYGSRKWRLAINAVAIRVDREHAARREGHVAGLLLMNIKPAVRSVGMGSFIHYQNVF